MRRQNRNLKILGLTLPSLAKKRKSGALDNRIARHFIYATIPVSEHSQKICAVCQGNYGKR